MVCFTSPKQNSIAECDLLQTGLERLKEYQRDFDLLHLRIQPFWAGWETYFCGPRRTGLSSLQDHNIWLLSTKGWHGHLNQFNAFKYPLLFLGNWGPRDVLEHLKNCPLSLFSPCVSKRTANHFRFDLYLVYSNHWSQQGFINGRNSLWLEVLS